MDFENSRLGNPNLLRGKILGGCRLEDRIGRGGMGSVYKALDLSLKQPVAVKILSPFLVSEPAILARFDREATAASRVTHPNVVRLFKTAVEDGLHFTIMEFIDGQNLAELLKRQGRLPLDRAIEITLGIASGLEALHQGAIIHRDIKPSNVLLGRKGAVKITDFGIARDLSELQRLTATGDLLGTVGFAAPEQFDSAEVDGRADLYSLGATLHYMLTGSRPPSDPRLPFEPLGDEIPEEIRRLLGSLLAKRPEDRPADARPVIEVLSAYRKRSGASRSMRLLSGNGTRAAAMILASAALFSAGALAAGGRWNNPGIGLWAPLIPDSNNWVLPAALFAAGMVTGIAALTGPRPRRRFGPRSVLGIALFAASILTAYVAGAATGAPTLRDALRTLLEHPPEVLASGAVLCAALGLLLGTPAHSSVASRVAGGILLLAALGMAALASSPGSPAEYPEYLLKRLPGSSHAWLSGACMLVSLTFLFVPRPHASRTPAIAGGIGAALMLIFHAGAEGGMSQLWEALSGSCGTLILAILLALAAWGVLPKELSAGVDGNTLSGTDRAAFPTTPT